MKHITIALIIAITTINLASAANIGISPANVVFDNVLRGGYSERIITITIDDETEREVEIQPRGEVEEWLSFSETKFTVSKGKPYYLKVSVNPPTDIQNGNYTGFLRVRVSSETVEQEEGTAAGFVIPVLDLYLIVDITDVEFKSCRAQSYSVNSVEEKDPIPFTTSILNNGNVRFNPRVKIDIWNQDQTEVVKTYDYSEIEISPTTEEELLIRVPSNGLEIGQYWAEISAIDCFSEYTLTFDILEEGALRANGILESIITKTWIDKEETVLIEPRFKNIGEKEVQAYFKGEITRGNKIIQIIETEKSLVPLNSYQDFEFYFTPKEAGKYLISGRVYYDNKKTFERSTVLNVRETSFPIKTIGKYLIYVILIVGIAVLTVKIRKEKKKYNRELRRLKR